MLLIKASAVNEVTFEDNNTIFVTALHGGALGGGVVGRGGGCHWVVGWGVDTTFACED